MATDQLDTGRGDGIERSALLSGDHLYRYTLERRWEPRGASGDGALWVMLNPSTADDRVDDATIRRCISFSRGFGFRSLKVVNLFALRATDPDELRKADDPIGPHNDRTLELEAKEAQQVIVAWGAQPTRWRQGRAETVTALLRGSLFYASDLKCLGRTQKGHPKHPLYLPADTELKRYPW